MIVNRKSHELQREVMSVNHSFSTTWRKRQMFSQYMSYIHNFFSGIKEGQFPINFKHL